MERCAAFLFFLLFATAASARDIDGVTIPESLVMDGEKAPLKLNGAGLRTRYTAKIYVAGLYLAQPAAAAEAVLDTAAPRAVALHLLRNSDSEQISSALLGSIAKNHSLSEIKPLRERMDQFKLMFPDLKKGQTVYLEFPGNGETRVRLDNTLLGTLQGKDFQRALLTIWLGRNPVDTGLKRHLLGAS